MQLLAEMKDTDLPGEFFLSLLQVFKGVIVYCIMHLWYKSRCIFCFPLYFTNYASFLISSKHLFLLQTDSGAQEANFIWYMCL